MEIRKNLNKNWITQFLSRVAHQGDRLQSKHTRTLYNDVNNIFFNNDKKFTFKLITDGVAYT